MGWVTWAACVRFLGTAVGVFGTGYIAEHRRSHGSLQELARWQRAGGLCRLAVLVPGGGRAACVLRCVAYLVRTCTYDIRLVGLCNERVYEGVGS
jgi:hypothetical protein